MKVVVTRKTQAQSQMLQILEPSLWGSCRIHFAMITQAGRMLKAAIFRDFCCVYK
jgi:hypothetical protein